METKNVFKSMVLAACCLGSVVLASCSKDDDNNPGLRFSAAKVEVAQGATATARSLPAHSPSRQSRATINWPPSRSIKT